MAKHKNLHECAKCGRIADDLTKHSLAGNHEPPFVWLCRSPCHDEEHQMGKFGVKMTRVMKAQRRLMRPTCEIQFPTEQITNPWARVIAPPTIEEAYKQTFKAKPISPISNKARTP